MLTREQLLLIMPGASALAEVYLPWLVATMDEFAVTDRAAFLAQIAPESDQLRRVSENLNYSAAGLARTWPNRFANDDGTPNARARRMQRTPEAIANYVYADRMGNGNEASGDGWRYRGAGLIQLTGKENQFAAGLYFNVDLLKIGEWLRTPEGATRSAGLFWKSHGCNECTSFEALTRRINGGLNGYADRLAFYNVAREVLCVS